MSDIVIREVTPAITIFSKWAQEWLLASTPMSPETKKALDKLGPVKYIVAGDAVHHMFLADYKKEYPAAKVVGVEPLEAKKKDVLTFDGLYGKDAPNTTYGFEPEITAVYFSGFANKDVAFCHAPSRTLIVADLLSNLPGTEQYSKSKASSKVPFFGTFGPHGKVHKYFLWSQSEDKRAMERDAQTVAQWDFERVIMCHGDVIEKDGNAVWREAYKWFLEGKP